MSFTLDPRLELGSLQILSTESATVRLRIETRWPWCLVIPRSEKTEFHQIERAQRDQLTDLVCAVADAITRFPAVTKVNIASFGNVVAQQHWHVIGRWPDDPAWPDSVIGASTEPMSFDALRQRAATIADLIALAMDQYAAPRT